MNYRHAVWILGIISVILLVESQWGVQPAYVDKGVDDGGLVKDIEEVMEKQDLELVVDNLDTIWGIDFLPSGEMVFTERAGRVWIYDDENGKKVIGDIEVTENAESGLMGIAVDSDFVDNGYIYIYYTMDKEGGTSNTISRFVLRDGKLVDEYVLLDRIPAEKYHDGGRLKFGPDGKLYATTGDATNPGSAQQTGSLAGKILRMNKDGSIPEDNPFGNYVWSYGHRNPQGLAWGGGEMYAAEHGPTRRDEVNRIIEGKNYGWPKTCAEEDYSVKPLQCYLEFTLAPGGIAFYDDALYIAGLKGEQVRKLTLADGKLLKEEEFITGIGRVRDVVVHDGWLYIGTSNKDGRGNPREGDDKILRVKL